MLASVWIAIAFVWTAIVFDIVSETAGEDRGIAAFGAVLADPGRTVTLWIVAALVASAVVAMALAVGYAWARFRERAIAAQLDARFDRLAAEEAAAAARRDQLAGRIAELHGRIEELARERQATQDVVGRERRRARELQALSLRLANELEGTARGLERAARTLEEPTRGPKGDEDGDRVVQLPDAEPSERP